MWITVVEGREGWAQEESRSKEVSAMVRHAPVAAPSIHPPDSIRDSIRASIRESIRDSIRGSILDGQSWGVEGEEEEGAATRRKVLDLCANLEARFATASGVMSLSSMISSCVWWGVGFGRCGSGVCVYLCVCSLAFVSGRC